MNDGTSREGPDMSEDTYSRDSGPLGLVVTTVTGRMVKKTDTATREFSVKNLVPGERIAVTSPLTGALMALVSRTKDTVYAEVADKHALMGHLHDTDPDALEDVDFITGSHGEVLAALKLHAPHLVGSEPDIRPQHLAHVLREAAKKEAVVPPGVEVKVKTGYVRVDLQDGGEDEVRALVQAGRVGVDGRVLPAIEGEVQA